MDKRALLDEACSRLPERRPGSIYEVAKQYAVLSWYDARTSGDIDWELSPRHLAFMTPFEKRSALTRDGPNVVVASVELLDDGAVRWADPPVELLTVGPEMGYRLGHSYPQRKTSKLQDYSLTLFHRSVAAYHLAGDREGAYGGRNLLDRFSGWANDALAQEVLEEGEAEGCDVLEALATIGRDEGMLAELSEAVYRALGIDPYVAEHDEEPPTDPELSRVFLTVRVREPGGEWRYPGEIAALNEVMVRRKTERLRDGISVDNASGTGVDMAGDGALETVTGGSAGLFGAYAKQQRTHMPGLSEDGSESWRTHPVTEETAAELATASGLFNSLRAQLRGGRNYYLIPYLPAGQADISPATFEAFHQLFTTLRDAPNQFDATDEGVSSFGEETIRAMRMHLPDDALAEGGTASEDTPSAASLFGPPETTPERPLPVFWYSRMVVPGNNPPSHLFEVNPVDTLVPARLADAHVVDPTSADPFAPGGIFAELAAVSASPLPFRPEADESRLWREVLSGFYFVRAGSKTRNSQQSDDAFTGTTADPQATRLGAALAGERIDAPPLLREYVNKLIKRQRALQQTSGERPVPIFDILDVYAQLRALNDPAVRLLVDRSGESELSTQFTMSESEITEPESRDERLEQFIDQHDGFDGGAIEGAFLLGGLVGRLTMYQEYKDVSNLMADRIPISSINGQTLKRATRDALKLNTTYATNDEGTSPSLNAHYTRRLADVVLEQPLDEYTASTVDLQLAYGVGLGYGMADSNAPFMDDDAEASDMADAEDEQTPTTQ